MSFNPLGRGWQSQCNQADKGAEYTANWLSLSDILSDSFYVTVSMNRAATLEVFRISMHAVTP